MNKYLIIDIDGTIANCEHRLHYITQKPKDFKSFYANVINDTPISLVIDIIEAMVSIGYTPIFITGRSNECFKDTLLWLRKYLSFPIHIDSLIMRNNKDFMADDIVKLKLLNSLLLSGEDININNTIILEDRQRVVDMWRGLGYKVLQVAKGDF